MWKRKIFLSINLFMYYWPSVFWFLSFAGLPNPNTVKVRSVRSKKLLNFIQTLPLGFRNKEHAEEECEDSEASKAPESSCLSQG